MSTRAVKQLQRNQFIQDALSISIEIAAIQGRLHLTDAEIAVLEQQAQSTCTYPAEHLAFWQRLESERLTTLFAPQPRIDPDEARAAMAEVTIGQRVRACAYCGADECSH